MKEREQFGNRIAEFHGIEFMNAAIEITSGAVQLLDGAGYVVDHPVERTMRDAKIAQIYEGNQPGAATHHGSQSPEPRS